jgi:nitrogen PTS system EIIA component
MILTKYMMKSCVLPEIESKNKADALKELTHLLFTKKKHKSVGPALDQILAREVNESTGIGRGIAVPHARVTGMKSVSCALGRVPDGLDFAAVDRKPVHFIFLICYAPTEQTTYLNFVATVARLLRDPKNYKTLLAAPDAESMCKFLEDSSRAFSEHAEQHPRKMKTDPSIEKLEDGHADLILLARLQLCQEMLDSARTGKTQIRERIERIRNLVTPRLLNHYDRLMKSRQPALVSVEGDTCQGCFMRLASKFAQQVRNDPEHIHTCPNCSRFIYVV